MSEEIALAGWSDVDGEDAESFRSYLDTVTGLAGMRAVKRRSYRLLSPGPGDRVLDIGCGTGADAAALAEATPEGSVVGVDRGLAMVREARDRAPAAAVLAGDAESLPLADDVADGVRADRVLQHLDRPLRAFDELRRVARPGGRVVVTDADWGTLAVEGADADPPSGVLDPTWACAANGRTGRRLRRWGAEAGLVDRTVETGTLALTEFDTADEVLGLTGRVERMRAAGALDPGAGERWLEGLQAADEAGSFFASLTMVTVAGTVPPRDEG